MKQHNLFRIILIATLLAFSYLVNGQEKEILVDKILLNNISSPFNNISSPWGMDFINNNELLYTQKEGKLIKYHIENNTSIEITGLPSIVQKGQGGLLDVALHPDFGS
jgi:glucose/arabinose dehydrogenase